MFQPEKYKDVWMQTVSGRAFPVLNPSPSDIDIEDIGHALANLCRFAGHVRKFYSVAQHSVIVSETVPPAYALEGLLHDAPEAYCVDLPRPLKHSGLLDNYRDIEDGIWGAVAIHFGIPYMPHPSIKEADVRCLLTEQRDLMCRQAKPWEDRAEPYDFAIIPLTPRQAKLQFMARYKELTAEREQTHGLQEAA
jgi:5'-deoxynucleotidase YfbR-like HD superfamily hydrolase